jgi:hypothetical protein
MLPENTNDPTQIAGPAKRCKENRGCKERTSKVIPLKIYPRKKPRQTSFTPMWMDTRTHSVTACRLPSMDFLRFRDSLLQRMGSKRASDDPHTRCRQRIPEARTHSVYEGMSRTQCISSHIPISAPAFQSNLGFGKGLKSPADPP